ncbi:MAG: hypothetical protein Q9220_007568 [cf. Caloplaca sp. 1 TL-2023]
MDPTGRSILIFIFVAVVVFIPSEYQLHRFFKESHPFKSMDKPQHREVLRAVQIPCLAVALLVSFLVWVILILLLARGTPHTPTAVISRTPPAVDSHTQTDVDSYNPPTVDSHTQTDVDSHTQPVVDSYNPPVDDSHLQPPQFLARTFGPNWRALVKKRKQDWTDQEYAFQIRYLEAQCVQGKENCRRSIFITGQIEFSDYDRLLCWVAAKMYRRHDMTFPPGYQPRFTEQESMSMNL